MKEEAVWMLKKDEIIKNLSSSPEGLSTSEAEKRIRKFGPNDLPRRKKREVIEVLLYQFKSPLVMVLIGASLISFLLQETTDALIILGIIFLNAILGFIQEYRSEKALEKLAKYIKYTAKVLRDEQLMEVDTRKLTVGDVILFDTGDIIPADLRILESHELSINESLITGESLPSEKTSNPINKRNVMQTERKNIAFMGTTVVNGSGKGIIYSVGSSTYLGKTASYLEAEQPEGNFQKSMREFGNTLIKIIMIGIFIIFATNSILGRNIFESFLFSMALAVGIVPESLPIIITISLSKGASNMAKKDVIVKKLVSIEDLGNLDILCCDKTGSITENEITLENFVGVDNKPSKRILTYGLLCNSSIIHKNMIRGNTIDVSIWHYAKTHGIAINKEYQKIYEIPLNYETKKMAVVVERNDKYFMICKGAPENILASSSHVVIEGKKYKIKTYEKKIEEAYKKLSASGYRVIAIAAKNIERKQNYKESDENNLTFLGFMGFIDPPKKNAKEALDKFRKMGVKIKILTGDDPIITKQIAGKVGFTQDELKTILVGEDIIKMNDEQLKEIVEDISIFARVTPDIKNRIIKALKSKGHVTGFLGDGVNDAPALIESDVGISVESGTDVAKDSADIILTRKSLKVIADGIEEGRKTFSNVTKYVLNTISANIGNMTTLGIISLFLNFLPLLPAQILLTNFLSDAPLLTISTDNVDKEDLAKPRKWNIKFIEKFAFFFGGISSIFDFITIAFLIFVLTASAQVFRTGWFLESVLSEIIITFAIRTRKRFYKSKPGKLLLATSIITIAISIFIIYSPFGYLFEFVPLVDWFLAAVFVILIAYFFMVELLKGFMMKEE